jgi:threonine synthase
MSEAYVERILKARVYDVAIESPLDPMPRLSARLGNEVLLKREDKQPVFSFKLRGAYNKIANLSETAAQRGVICASAGNHAQGVALAARRRGIPAVIVMPVTTPAIKVQAVAALGGEVVLHGDVFDAAYEHAMKLAAAGIRASLRRSGCDRRAGHHRRGDPAAGGRQHRRHLRRRGRWRAHRRRCRLCEGAVPADQDHRR